MSHWHEDKARRTALYQKRVESISEDCGACSGSGRYDHNGSPACGACDGTGKQLTPLDKAIEYIPYYLQRQADLRAHITGMKYGDRWTERELQKVNQTLRRIKEKLKRYRPGTVIEGL